ncbi:MAG: CoA transferase [Micavibrio aeruginosavorus]|uniref:CoA transferase n=1 Tax=Micavibrio aeruginosavorus TaxID=349221 RepID=A0A7T5R218_9BACT|nr:MAG: CoA transferase [Micavibrio aeruginosavorus]
MSGPLNGIRVLDLSRVLAGPSCTQILGDLGADIIKVEKPGEGDDTRKWGPPFLKDAAGNDTAESAYYLSCNRNKRSIAVDIAHPEGQKLIHGLLGHCDILIENFKVGGLEKYGLGYEQIKAQHPHIIYASITGFGQTGPLASEPGYDLMAQALGGLMAVTGEPEGMPMKVGVALSDIMTGLYAAIGVLAALHKRKETGRGDLVDVALLDCTLASLTNLAQFYLTGGAPAKRWGNAHSTIVPYQAFPAADGHLIIAVGNDKQFARLSGLLGHPEWAQDERFSTNRARVSHRDLIVSLIGAITPARTVADWVKALQDIDIPTGPVNRMDQVFAMEQIQARGMEIEMNHPTSPAPIHLVGSPLKLTENPVEYRLPPPICGEHTHQILKDILNKNDAEMKELVKAGIVST